MSMLDQMVDKTTSTLFDLCQQNSLSLLEHYLGGKNHMDQLLGVGRTWKVSNGFYQIYKSDEIQNKISSTASRLAKMINLEKKRLSDHMGYLKSQDVEIMAERIEKAKDVAWLLQWEILGNVEKVRNLMSNQDKDPGADRLRIYRMINSVLNSLDRLEVRGRDSAGISLMFILDESEYKNFENALSAPNRPATLLDQFRQRIGKDVLVKS
jgi:glutamine---fructose-6-phosphate transaminase (isomerizing)